MKTRIFVMLLVVMTMLAAQTFAGYIYTDPSTLGFPSGGSCGGGYTPGPSGTCIPSAAVNAVAGASSSMAAMLWLGNGVGGGFTSAGITSALQTLGVAGGYVAAQISAALLVWGIAHPNEMMQVYQACGQAGGYGCFGGPVY
jgi:hypothetical protein